MNIKRKRIYNPDTNEKVNEAKIFGGNPSGIIDFERPTNKWAYNLWDKMLGNTWFPNEVDTSKDKEGYKKLTDVEKRAYDLVLAQLIFNDSEQTNNLIDNINPYITDPVVNACLVRQAFEEALHSKSYAVLASDTSVNYDEIYELYKKDKKLYEKNNFVAEMYEKLSVGEITEEKLILAMIANNILEGIIFFGGFTLLWSLNDKMPGTSTMISFICRDENTHLTLFKNMHNTTLRQYPELRNKNIENKARELVKKAVDIEIEWTKYVTQNKMLGFSDKSIEIYIQNKGDKILKNLGYEPLFNNKGTSPLLKLEEKFSDPNNIKTAFFENKVFNYTKGTLNLDDF